MECARWVSPVGWRNDCDCLFFRVREVSSYHDRWEATVANEAAESGAVVAVEDHKPEPVL